MSQARANGPLGARLHGTTLRPPAPPRGRWCRERPSRDDSEHVLVSVDTLDSSDRYQIGPGRLESAQQRFGVERAADVLAEREVLGASPSLQPASSAFRHSNGQHFLHPYDCVIHIEGRQLTARAVPCFLDAARAAPRVSEVRTDAIGAVVYDDLGWVLDRTGLSAHRPATGECVNRIELPVPPKMQAGGAQCLAPRRSRDLGESDLGAAARHPPNISDSVAATRSPIAYGARLVATVRGMVRAASVLRSSSARARHDPASDRRRCP